jgi:hypothetical protein
VSKIITMDNNNNETRLFPYLICELKVRIGGGFLSWRELLESQLYNEALAEKANDGKIWVIVFKGFEICIFKFDVFKFVNDGPFKNFEPLNLNSKSKKYLDLIY